MGSRSQQEIKLTLKKLLIMKMIYLDCGYPCIILFENLWWWDASSDGDWCTVARYFKKMKYCSSWFHPPPLYFRKSILSSSPLPIFYLMMRVTKKSAYTFALLLNVSCNVMMRILALLNCNNNDNRNDDDETLIALCTQVNRKLPCWMPHLVIIIIYNTNNQYFYHYFNY